MIDIPRTAFPRVLIQCDRARDNYVIEPGICLQVPLVGRGPTSALRLREVGCHAYTKVVLLLLHEFVQLQSDCSISKFVSAHFRSHRKEAVTSALW